MNPPLHPIVVHFPIVLVVVAGVFYAIGLLREKKELSKIGFALHAASLLFSVVAIFTGDYEATSLAKNPDLEILVGRHETMAMIATWLSGILGVWAYLRQSSHVAVERLVFVVVFWGMIGLLAFSAHIGGSMVFGYGAGVRSQVTVQPSDSVSAIPQDK